MSIYIIAGVRFLNPYIVIPLGFVAFIFAWLFIAAGAHSGSWDHERRDGGADRRYKHNNFHYNYSPEDRVLWGAIARSMRNWGLFTILAAIVLSMLRSHDPEEQIKLAPDMQTPAVDLAAPPDLAPAQAQSSRQRYRKWKPPKVHYEPNPPPQPSPATP